MTTNTETPAQAHCPYCHPNEDGTIKRMDVLNGSLVIDPEFSELINYEDWDYDNGLPSNYSDSHHINYCYMCGRRLNGE